LRLNPHRARTLPAVSFFEGFQTPPGLEKNRAPSCGRHLKEFDPSETNWTEKAFSIAMTAFVYRCAKRISTRLLSLRDLAKALVFILRRKWDMIGWMIFYILAIPAFSFLLPLYSFWKMDDFSWGQTRIVMGEAGKKMIVHVRAFLFYPEISKRSRCASRTKANLTLVPFR